MTPVVVAIGLVLFLWAAAEAFSWPVVPDAALALVVFAAPHLALGALVAVVVGTTVGGTVAVALWRHGTRWPLPMTTDSMQTRVRRWLARGPAGLRYQPLTAVPYKVFVVEAAGRDFPIGTWAVLTVGFRGARMLAVTLASAGAAALVSALVAPSDLLGWKLVVVGVGIAIFLIGWRLAWVLWSEPHVARVDGAT